MVNHFRNLELGVKYGCQPKNRATPKWMVEIMENPIKMHDLWGVSHYFWKHPYDQNLQQNSSRAQESKEKFVEISHSPRSRYKPVRFVFKYSMCWILK